MQKKVVVISLGGSLIIPDDVDSNFLRKFRRTILRYTKSHKFIIVCGGGSIARKYINALRAEDLSDEIQSFVGISATRMNARFVSYFFRKNQQYGIPHTIKEIENYLKSHDIVFCGALEYKPEQTSDSTAAEIAVHFKSKFINLTNVSGLYTKNPKEHKDAKFIPRIGWKQLFAMAHKNKYKPGQHFVLDQTASGIIMRKKIPTYILGSNLKELEAVLHGKKFKGTLISG